MFSYNLILYEILFYFIYTKNIVLNINKISFNDFIQEKKIDDYINYDIYTEIKLGTPPQLVTHFIEPHERVFQFKKIEINYNKNKFNNSVINFFENKFYYFNSSKSITYIDSFSDNFIFNEEIIKLNFTIYYNNRDKKNKLGIIGLNTFDEKREKNIFFKDLFSFINQLKQLNVISEYCFYFLYNNNIFHNDINLGKLIIGEYPQKQLSAEEIKIYSASNDKWSIISDEILFEDYKENNMHLNFDFNSKFIKGSKNFGQKIKKFFFDDLIKNGLCFNETIEENKFSLNYEIFSCENNEIIKEKIKSLPKLNFINKGSNLIFSFDYNDLFKLFPNKNRLYFMIIFRTDIFSSLTDTWLVGEIFLTKYSPTFNLESKTISFYTNQNNKTKNIKIEKEEKEENNSNNNMRIILEITMGIFIIICIYLLYRKYRKSRKLLANELEDNNYAYISKDNNNEKQLISE